jgi:hypothetical protein
MTRIFHGIEKHKFAVTSLDALFMETVPGPPEYEK